MKITSYQAQLSETLKRYQSRSPERERNLYRIAQGDVFAVDTPERVRMFLQRRGIGTAEANSLIAGVKKTDGAATESIGVREPFGLERIMGTNDLMGVAYLERALDVSRTIARIWVDIAAGAPAGYGSGFLVSPRLLMTNNHVLRDAAIARVSKAQFNYQLGPDGNPCPDAVFTLDPATLFVTNTRLDYSLVAVAERADNGRVLTDFGFNTMMEEEGKAIAAQWVNIIQHPDGGYKQLALRENRLVDVFDAFLTYLTDTAPGSSGSPVYNDRWEVIGLHHSGVPAKDAQGRILAIDGTSWTEDMGENRIKWISNEGIRISRIIADLKSQVTGGKPKELLDQMLSRAPSPVGTPERSTPAGPAHVLRVPRSQNDGSATWIIPIEVTVRVPGLSVDDRISAGTGGATASAIPAVGAPPSVEAPSALAEAKAALAGRSDVLAVKMGYVFENGWITKKPAIVVKVRKRLAPGPLREANVTPIPASFRGVPVEVVNPTVDDLFLAQPAAAEAEAFRMATSIAEEIVYQPPAGVKLGKFSEKMKVRASVSPDHGWPVLEDFLNKTSKRLVVGMYDFGAVHIIEAIEKAGNKTGFQKVTLAIQAGSSEGSGTKAKDLPDSKVIKRLEDELGGKFESTFVKIGIKNGWVATSYHIKVAVRDSKAFWLSSGNWQSSNQPKADPLNETPQKRSWLTKFNRDWHIVIEHADLAKLFESYILHDFQSNKALAGPEEIAIPDILLPRAVFVEATEARRRPFKFFAPFTANRTFTVRPLLTPDNFKNALLDIIRGADDELLIQNQTFNAARDDQVELKELLDAILERQNAGVDVRIIFRILDSTKARENLEALQDLGFDMTKVKVQPNCHTKAVIADRKRVLVGSQNLSQLGITLNRDASLLFDDKDLAKYFAEIIDHDWNNLARQDIGSESLGPEIATAEMKTPADMERLSWKDYLEMA